ncbi:bifunctional nuclease family protein [Synechococcus sp. CS-205]|jgi:bifunctional DNase/RNase|uniref:bifunctional nuclease family protein n=1 Tax=Synechococcus sp. CS-205 TaxID=2847984 RepID=UPI00223C50F9|nr:bifunctional nuclease family protein [Synechococcus sp. CS-205]MCT0248221.1 bifunctional nuclease family protein [Synechococcus sp. CS-205]
MVEMRVAGIALDAANRSPIVLLRDPSGRRQVPIWIDQAQAQNILAGLGGTTPPRPLSHDLMAGLMAVGGVSLERVIIHTIEDATFRAVLKLSDSEGETSELDCRPSDAIALALRTGSGIWMLEEVVADASIPVDSEADAEEKADFRRFIDQVSPAELIRNLSRAQRQDNPEGGEDDSGPGPADSGPATGPMDEPPAPSSSNS